MRRFTITIMLLFTVVSLYAKESKSEKTFGHFLTGGVGILDLKSMDSKLNQLGYKAPKDWAYNYGLSFYARRKLVFEAEISRLRWKDRNYKGNKTAMNSWLSSFNIGYNVIPYGSKIALYPFIGSGFTKTNIKLYSENVGFEDAVKSGLNEIDLLKRDYVGRVGLGFDTEIKRLKRKNRTLTVGIKAGYLFDLTKGDNWESNETSIKKGPEVKLNGYFLNVTVGKNRRKDISKNDKCIKCKKHGV